MQVFKAKQDWEKFHSKQGVTDHFRFKIWHAAGQAFVDVFNPKILAEGTVGTDHECISALLLVKQSAVTKVLASSGLAHVYLKPEAPGIRRQAGRSPSPPALTLTAKPGNGG